MKGATELMRAPVSEPPILGFRVRAGAFAVAVVAVAIIIALPIHQGLQVAVWLGGSSIVVYIVGVTWVFVSEARRQREVDLQALWEQMNACHDPAGREQLRDALLNALDRVSQRRLNRWYATGHCWPSRLEAMDGGT